jgi:hypothetical protein
MLFAFFALNLNTPIVGSGTTVPPTSSAATPLPTTKPLTINTPVSVSPRPTTVKIIFPQPLTGTIIKGTQLSGGEGELKIENNNGRADAVGVLTHTGQKNSIIGVYIRKGTSYTISNINDGTYDLYVLSGENWNPNTKKFESYPSYTRFEDTFPYETTSSEYTTWRVTLYEVVGGTAKTDVVSENNFPDL